MQILQKDITNMFTGERDGFRTSLEQTQQLLQESKQGQYDQQRHMGELENQVHTLSAQKQEVM